MLDVGRKKLKSFLILSTVGRYLSNILIHWDNVFYLDNLKPTVGHDEMKTLNNFKIIIRDNNKLYSTCKLPFNT